MKKSLLGLGLVVSGLLASNTFEVNINNNTLEIANSLDLNERVNLPSSSTYSLDARYLKTEKEEMGDNHYLANLGFKVASMFAENTNISFGLGMDVLYASAENDKFVSVPFTLFSEYKITEKFFIDANVKYSPKILSFKDAVSYKEIRGTVNYSITTNAIVYAGARRIDAKFENYTLEYDRSAFAGFKFTF